MIADARAELKRLAKQRPALAGPAHVLGELLPFIFAEPFHIPAPNLTEEQAHAKCGAGVPLLRGATLDFDPSALDNRFHAVGCLLERLTRVPLRASGVRPTDQLLAVLADQADARIEYDAREMTILRFAAFPMLHKLQTAFTALTAATSWPHGFCPICGSMPLLGEFRGLEQTRWLRCGWCAAEWESARLQCPQCGERDHRQLGYLHVEGEETQYRAATCETCRGYVKMAATLTALSPPQLLVAEVATLHLDLAAAERGYGVGGVS